MNIMTNEKRYNTLNNYYKNKYGKKVFKVSLNGDFTCPNLDGSLDDKGCIYCSKLGSGDYAGNKNDTLAVQFKKQKEIMSRKWPDAYFIPYLQANTNTYGDIEVLKKLYTEAITLDEDIVMLSISTRSDCLNDDIIDLLSKFNKNIPIQIEIGLQSIHQQSLDFLNRCHNLNSFNDAIDKLSRIGVEIVVHIINSIPGETHNMMIETAKYLSKLPIHGVKIHMLHIMKDTELGLLDSTNDYKLLSLEEYKNVVCDQLEYLRDDIIIHRLSGDSPKELLIKPEWTLKKLVVMNEIDKEMRKRNSYQGIKYGGK